nr:immunoglobulin light chain junction region [Macaca mulatta]MOY12663.1 immunoglobulin light chain junction region [Macaca mulatta]
CQHGFGILYSF